MKMLTRYAGQLLTVALCQALVFGPGTGCGKPPGKAADAGVLPDAAPPDAGPDAGPLRQLGQRGLFGDAPVENRMYDPSFSRIDGVAWDPLTIVQNAYAVSRVTRQYQRTPRGLPLLRLEPPTGESQGPVTGLFKSTSGPLEVSVWLGREGGFDGAEATVTVLGMFPDGGGALDVEGDPGSTPLELEGVSWVRYTAWVENGPFGWAWLRIVNQIQDPLFISAPVVSRTTARQKRGRTPVARRPLRPAEHATIRDYIRRMGDRFGGPPQRDIR